MREATSRSTARGATTFFSGGSRATRARGGRRPDLSEIDLRAVEPTLSSRRFPSPTCPQRRSGRPRSAPRSPARLAARARFRGRTARACGPVGQGFGRFRRDRPHPGGRALQRPRRSDPGLDRARRRRHRAADRGQRARSRRTALVDRFRPHQRFRRAADPPDRRPAFPSGRLRRRLARSRLVAHHDHHREPGPGSRAGGQPAGRRVPPDARSGNDRDLCRRIAHAVAAAALSLGAGRVQGQVDQPHALRGHSDRHRRPSRPVPDHRVRRARGDDLPGRGRARLGGVRLCLHRLRFLAEDVRPRGRVRADLARGRSRRRSRRR